MRPRLRFGLALLGVIVGLLTLGVAGASATFEATLSPRKASARAVGPTFEVEAGGGRRTRILDLEVAGGRCGSIYAPLLDASRTKPGFADGKGAAVFALAAAHLQLRIELAVSPRGEALRGSGLLDATVGGCHERVPLDLVSTTIRGGGRHT
jgi:hypothetical protein